MNRLLPGIALILTIPVGCGGGGSGGGAAGGSEDRVQRELKSSFWAAESEDAYPDYIAIDEDLNIRYMECGMEGFLDDDRIAVTLEDNILYEEIGDTTYESELLFTENGSLKVVGPYDDYVYSYVAEDIPLSCDDSALSLVAVSPELGVGPAATYTLALDYRTKQLRDPYIEIARLTDNDGFIPGIIEYPVQSTGTETVDIDLDMPSLTAESFPILISVAIYQRCEETSECYSRSVVIERYTIELNP